MGYAYKNGHLVLKNNNDSDLELLDFCKNYSGPFYLYNLDHFKERIHYFCEKFGSPHHVHYAMKANHHPNILKVVQEEGLGVDVVSGGEIKRALDANFKGNQIVFSGVAKSKDEINFALKSEIKQINVESLPEMIRIGEISKSLKLKAPISIRFNPDVNPDTHPYITTGFKENKFGISSDEIYNILEILKKYHDSLKLVGVSIHIGSQLLEFASVNEAIKKTLPLIRELIRNGHPAHTFDVGGGVGINYHRDLESEEMSGVEEYCQLVKELTNNENLEIICEPGRILVAPVGILITRVEYIKETSFKNFAIVDAGMNLLLRPALYQAYHRILPVRMGNKNNQTHVKAYDVVGPICESSDVLGRDRVFDQLQEEDFLAVMDVGAYGAVMSSGYNSHGELNEIFVLNGKRVGEF